MAPAVALPAAGATGPRRLAGPRAQGAPDGLAGRRGGAEGRAPAAPAEPVVLVERAQRTAGRSEPGGRSEQRGRREPGRRLGSGTQNRPHSLPIGLLPESPAILLPEDPAILVPEVPTTAGRFRAAAGPTIAGRSRATVGPAIAGRSGPTEDSANHSQRDRGRVIPGGPAIDGARIDRPAIDGRTGTGTQGTGTQRTGTQGTGTRGHETTPAGDRVPSVGRAEGPLCRPCPTPHGSGAMSRGGVRGWWVRPTALRTRPPGRTASPRLRWTAGCGLTAASPSGRTTARSADRGERAEPPVPGGTRSRPSPLPRRWQQTSARPR